MPMTNRACPECSGALHSDDLFDGECVTPGCGADLTEHLGEDGYDLPEWEAEP